jgi:hypothetical protein
MSTLVDRDRKLSVVAGLEKWQCSCGGVTVVEIALIAHRLTCVRYLEKSVVAHEFSCHGAEIGFHGIDGLKFKSEEANAI